MSIVWVVFDNYYVLLQGFSGWGVQTKDALSSLSYIVRTSVALASLCEGDDRNDYLACGEKVTLTTVPEAVEDMEISAPISFALSCIFCTPSPCEF
jgi:hypothetical protein